jgi:hypothetical protein
MILLNFVEPMHAPTMYVWSYPTNRPFFDQSKCAKLRIDNTRNGAITMGPVTTAVVLYGIERLVARVSSGQIHRKGVQRKIRRLMSMVLEFHTMCEIIQDFVEDMLTP